MIKQYEHPRLVGNPCMIHPDFEIWMDLFCELLEKHKIKALVTSSFRNTIIVPGAIVKPAKMSNHLIGHAIDCNIYDALGHLHSSLDLSDPKGEILAFITDVVAGGMRWGGHFRIEDSVHFDDGMNVKSPTRWHEIYQSIVHPNG